MILYGRPKSQLSSNLYTEEDLEEARAEMPEYEPDFNEY